MRVVVFCVFSVCAVSACSVASLFGDAVLCDDDAACPDDEVCVQGVCRADDGDEGEGEGEVVGEGEGDEGEGDVGEGEGDVGGEGEGDVVGEGEGEGACGNGNLDPGEDCDDGNDANDDGCEIDCTPSLVGVTAGNDFTCVRTRSGRVFCWGRNGRGQLGRGSLDAGLTPQEVPLAVPTVDFDAGSDHVCAIGDDGKVAAIARITGYR